MSYQGSLTDSGGEPVSGAFQIAFTLYDAAVAGSLLWTETQSVTVTNGAFDVVFGADGGNALDPTAFENPVFLGVRVVDGPGVPGGGDPEMTPRQALAAVGYAIRAKTVEVDTLNALSCAAGEVAEWDGAAWVCGSPGLRALRQVTVNTTVPAGQRASVLAECDPGETIVSGGWSGQNILSEGSWPAFFFSPQAWAASFFNDKGVDIDVTVRAICGTL
jgi:hypothetical protein